MGFHDFIQTIIRKPLHKMCPVYLGIAQIAFDPPHWQTFFQGLFCRILKGGKFQFCFELGKSSLEFPNHPGKRCDPLKSRKCPPERGKKVSEAIWSSGNAQIEKSLFIKGLPLSVTDSLDRVPIWLWKQVGWGAILLTHWQLSVNTFIWHWRTCVSGNCAAPQQPQLPGSDFPFL